MGVRQSSGAAIGIFVALALVAAGLTVFALQQTMSRVSEHKTKVKTAARYSRPLKTFTAKSLYDAYNYNQVLADEAYRGAEFIVTGTVDRIGKDILDEPYVTLQTNSELFSVQCYFADGKKGSLAKLRPGDEVEFYATGRGMTINVILEECRVKKISHQ